MAPIVEYGGIIFDGQRRAELCAALGIKPWRLQCKSRDQMLAALWVAEPERAIKEAGKLSLHDYAKTFAVSPVVIAQYQRAARGAPPVKYNRRKVPHAKRDTAIVFWCSHQFRALLQLGSSLTKHSLSEYIRSHMAERARLDVPHKLRVSLKRGQLLGKSYRKPER